MYKQTIPRKAKKIKFGFIILELTQTFKGVTCFVLKFIITIRFDSFIIIHLSDSNVTLEYFNDSVLISNSESCVIFVQIN